MLEDFGNLLLDIFLWVPRVIYESIVEGILYLVNLLPTDPPDVQGAFTGWSGDILYFLTIFEVQYAISALFSAYIARFILRRIPLIG